jgi:hypothetical protein
MARISMLIPDDALAEIDAYADGNRTRFMVSAALARVNELRRALVDAEVEAACLADAERDLRVYREWEPTLGDGLV